MKVGDGLGILAILLWMTFAVGPWWLGVLIFLMVWIINTATHEDP